MQQRHSNLSVHRQHHIGAEMHAHFYLIPVRDDEGTVGEGVGAK
jgi:hypothetical protein